MTEKRLFLLDAMALIYRAFYALQRNPRITTYGLDTSASYGFTNFILELINKENPTHIAVCTDPMGPTFRHDEFEEYKATRSKMPEDIISNLPIIEELLQGFNIPLISCEGYEADDVIGTISKDAEKKGFQVFMVTPDKDFGQLITDNIKIFKPAYGKTPSEIIDKDKLCQKYNIKDPIQLIDYLGLVGDSSDNIPGVKGVGPVAAKKLLTQFDSIESIFQNIDKIKNKSLKSKLEDNKENAFMSKSLATIVTDVPCKYNIDDFKFDGIFYDNLKDIFDRLEFRTISKRLATNESLNKAEEVKASEQKGGNDIDFGLFADVNKKTSDKKEPKESNQLSNILGDLDSEYDNINTVKHKYTLIETDSELKDLINTLYKSDVFAFDTETTSLDANNCDIVGLSFSVEPHEAYFIHFDENKEKTNKVLKLLSPIFSDKKKLIVGQNIKYDILVLKWYGIEIEAQLFDTMIAHYLINPELRHNMDAIARSYLNYIPVPIESLIGKKGVNQGSMKDVPISQLTEYAAEDADVTYRLYLKLKPELEKTDNSDLFHNVEMALIKVLASMEFEGVRLDTEILSDYAKTLETQIKKLEKSIFEHVGYSFNISSPKQLGEALFDKLVIHDKPKKTKSGQYATGEDVLIKLQYAHPVVQDILDYRSLTKLLSTYIEPLPLLINSKTGKIHTTYQQAVVATGRLSSINPNLQNIPIRTGAGKEIRKAFIASDKDHVLLSADYSQIELRIIAHIADDEKMIQAFNNKKDIHTATAAEIFNKSENMVTADDRRMAKTVNFGIIYGISAFGLSERLHISRRQASDIITEYFTKYPGIKQYMESIVKKAEETGYVETLLGRRRYITNIDSRNSNFKKAAERNAINAPIQGSSADMIKLAMIKIDKAFKEKNIKSKMILQVHDELIFDTLKSEVDTVRQIIETEMRNAIKLSVPIEVSIGEGDNWFESH